MDKPPRLSRTAADTLRVVILTCVATFTLFWATRASSSIFRPLTRECNCEARGGQLHSVNFTRREDFWDLSPAGDALWSGLLPENGGFVFHPLHDDSGLGYLMGISMFHQLHCLQMIRHAIQDLQSGRVMETSEHKRSGSGQHETIHWVHCLDYLAQAIQCAADRTQEPVKGHLVDGYGVVHQCRDAQPLWELAEASVTRVES